MSITGSNNPFACEPVVFANANQIISLGTITRNGNQFTFSVGFVWKINGVIYQNTAPVVLTIAEASEGFNRIDNALLNTSNTIELQQGLESETIALKPVAPDTNIILTSWNISGDAIEDTETPIVGTQFKQKNESRKFSTVLSGTDQVIEFRAAGHQHYAILGTVTSVAGFGKTFLLASPSAEIPYAGKDIFFENKTDHNITLKNNFSGVDVKFDLGTDLIVPTNGIVWLKYNPNTEQMDLFFKSWTEPVDISGKLDKVTTSGVERVYTINADGSQGTKATSLFKDVIEGYFNGTNFYTDALFTNLITHESGRVYVALNLNSTYRWSGSGYVQLGDTQVYKTINANTTLNNTYHNAVVWVTATCNITIPSGLRLDFNCTVRTFTGAIATYLTSGTVINTESDGSIQSAKTMAYIAQYSSNNYIISGGGLS